MSTAFRPELLFLSMPPSPRPISSQPMVVQVQSPLEVVQECIHPKQLELGAAMSVLLQLKAARSNAPTQRVVRSFRSTRNLYMYHCHYKLGMQRKQCGIIVS